MGNNNSCSKLLVSHQLYKRRLPIINSKYKYILTLTYKLPSPETYGSGIGFGTGYFHYYAPQITEYTRELDILQETQESGEKVIENIKNGYCFKCGNVQNCIEPSFWHKN